MYVVMKRLAAEERRRYRGGCDERSGPRSKLDHRALLVFEATLGFLIGEAKSLRIWFRRLDRQRMQRAPDVRVGVSM
jgi:hypothetical protein